MMERLLQGGFQYRTAYRCGVKSFILLYLNFRSGSGAELLEPPEVS